MAEKDPDQFRELDAAVLHVGTNNISDADNSDKVCEEIKHTIQSIKSANSDVKIIVSSVLPRKNDRLVNDMIEKTNTSLQTMCEESGHFFLNNSNTFIHQGLVDASLYRDNIHLNAKGGKTLGTSLRSALNNVLGIQQSPPLADTTGC